MLARRVRGRIASGGRADGLPHARRTARRPLGMGIEAPARQRLRGRSGDEARALEPALGRHRGGVVTPAWSHVSDPKAGLGGLPGRRATPRRDGGHGEAPPICAGPAGLGLAAGASRWPATRSSSLAGAWSAALAARSATVLLESERGYNLTLPDPASRLGREMIFAEENSSRLRSRSACASAAPPNSPAWTPRQFRPRAALAQLGAAYLPGLARRRGRMDGPAAGDAGQPAGARTLAASPRRVLCLRPRPSRPNSGRDHRPADRRPDHLPAARRAWTWPVLGGAFVR